MFASRDNVIHNAPKPLKYDVIDLDPYGSSIPYMECAIQAISDGGKMINLFLRIQ